MPRIIIIAVALCLLLSVPACRKAEPARGSAAASKPFVAAERDASRGQTLIYHKPTCKWAEKISEHRRLGWDSEKDAQDAGYRPCKVCIDPNHSR